MCDFLSGWINLETKWPELADLRSHSATQEKLGWKSDDLKFRREWEWLSDNRKSLSVRTSPDDADGLGRELRAELLHRWPTRLAAIMECVAIVDRNYGHVDVSNSEIIFLNLPNATRVDCYNCPGLTALDLPKATRVYCYNCPGLTALDLPKATRVYCSNCPGLTALDLPKATEVDCSNCPGLTALDLPKATEVYCSNCPGLTALDLPKATRVDCYNCPGLTALDLPKACRIIK